MGAAKIPLEVTLKAVDKATAPVRALTVAINRMTAPVRNLKIFDQLEGLGKALNAGGIGKALGGVGSAVRGVGSEVFGLAAKLAGIGLAAGAAFGAVIKSAMDAGDQLGEQAGRVGMTVDAFASLRFAAEQSDVSQEMFAASMDKLNKQLGEMTVGKGGEFLAFLNEIGPGFAAQMKGAKGTEAAMALLTDAFAKIDDPARRATLAAHAFGKSNLQMGEFLHGGSSAIQEQQVEFMRLFGSQEASSRAAGELDNATRKTATAFLGLQMAAAGALFPALKQLADKLTKFLVDNREGIAAWADKAAASIQAWLDSGGFDRLIANLTAIASTVEKVITWLGPMGTAMAGVTVLSLPLIASLGTLAASLLSLAIEAVPLVVSAVGFMAPAFTAATAAVGSFLSATLALAAPMAAILLPLTALMMLGKAIYDNWGDIKLLFSDAFRALKWAAVDAWNFVKPILAKLSLVPGLGGWKASIAAVDSLMPAQATLGAAAAAPAPASSQSSEARVSVDFANLPPGARVSTEPNSSQPVDLSLNYSMVAP